MIRLRAAPVGGWPHTARRGGAGREAPHSPNNEIGQWYRHVHVRAVSISECGCSSHRAMGAATSVFPVQSPSLPLLPRGGREVSMLGGCLVGVSIARYICVARCRRKGDEECRLCARVDLRTPPHGYDHAGWLSQPTGRDVFGLP